MRRSTAARCAEHDGGAPIGIGMLEEILALLILLFLNVFVGRPHIPQKQILELLEEGANTFTIAIDKYQGMIVDVTISIPRLRICWVKSRLIVGRIHACESSLYT